MNSVDKLREFAADINERELNSQIVWLHNDDGSEEVYIKPGFVDGWHRAVDKVIDDIQREYMELPKDKNGEPIHVGDVLQGVYKRFEVCAVSNYYAYHGEGKHFDRADLCTHYHAPTVEDVLSDAALAIVDVGYVDVPGIGNVPKLSVDDFKLNEWMELNHDKLREVLRDE